MRAKDVLLEAIESFSGTVIFVSHDRYFLDRLATKVLEVKDGGVVIYPGNFAEYIRDKEEQEARAASTKTLVVERSSAPAAPVAANVETTGVEDAAGKDKVKRLNPIKLKQMEDRCTFLEEEVPRIEAAIAHTEGALGNFVSVAETERQSALLEDLRRQLAQSTDEWEDLMMQLEEQAAHS
jgi:ATP-binding cassette subfamily F protein 3